MPQEELDDMPIWQNHEQRITALEFTMTGLSNKMEEVDKTIKEGNKEQKDKLEMIDKRLISEFFDKKKIDHSNMWRLVLTITGSFLGAGGILYVLIEKVF